MTIKAFIVKTLACLLCVVVLGSCKDDNGGSSITLTSATMMEMPPVVNQKKTITFRATADWTASCAADWLVFSPKKGSAGDNLTITVTTASTNRTKGTRTAQLMLKSGGETTHVSLIQSAKYAIFDQKEYTVDAKGGSLVLDFKSNTVESDDMGIMFTDYDWIHWADESRLTRAEWEGHTYPISVEPNTTDKGRVALFVLALRTDNEQGWMGLDTAFIYQNPISETYESSDFSADGTVKRLQKATLGRGIPIVLMGDGFADIDVADGTYDQVMHQTCENLFSEEPVRSLRDYFDVFAVTAVSRSRGVGKDHSTVFSTLPSNISTSIDFDADKVTAYLDKVDSIDTENALAVVILNSNGHNGVTMLLLDEDTKLPRQYSVSLCSLIDGVDGETFRQVLVHETIGHGLAKLADEYGYEHYGAPDDKVVRQLRRYHEWGWMVNADVADDDASIWWSSFIGDSRFAAENIGRYEGAFTYALGVYRPTEESMMRSNQSPFNAPSRKAIYDKVLQLGEGLPASSFEEFAAFDEQHKPTRWSYATRSHSPWPRRRLAPPIIRGF